ncbi:MAG: hypothetical protein JW700_03330 [Candidatus Aenigmarchaeota archaeon]|nr:hypothetical protein [Candidatus Aenigmarchaeota archaeon]
MKGVSAIIVSILILIIAVSLVSLTYSFFSVTVSETAQSGIEAAEQTSKTLLSTLSIESVYLPEREVYVRNTGRGDATNIVVFVDGVADSSATIVPSTIHEDDIGVVTLSFDPEPGAVISVSSGQGGSSSKTLPGESEPDCITNGLCDGKCPSDCTISEDPDCGCYNNNECCGLDCNYANDNDCEEPCKEDGETCTSESDCCSEVCISNVCGYPETGIIGFWNFDDSGDFVASDTSGNGNDCNLINMETTDWVSGISNQGLRFNGADEYLNCGDDSTLNVVGEITVMMWIKPDTWDAYDRIISEGNGGDGSYIIARSGSTGSIMAQYRYGGVNYYRGNLGNVIPLNEWTHVAFTFDGTSSIKVYVNGIRIDDSSPSGYGFGNSANLNIGRRSDGTNYFDGTIDEILIYNTELAQEEIQQEYQKYEIEEANPIVFWSFDEGSGSIAVDSAGSNDGTIYASGRNQITNPSFESDKTGWGSGGGTWDIVSSDFYHVSKSSRFQDLTGDSYSEYAGPVSIPVTTDNPITISTYSKGENIVLGSVSWHYALIIGRWYDSSDNEITSYTSSPYTRYPDSKIGSGTGTWDWKRSYTTHVPPPGAVKYNFTLGLVGSATGNLWVDAFQIEYGSTLTTFTDSAWKTGSDCNNGNCLEFDGYDDYVDIGTMDITGSEMTMMAWIKVDDFGTSDQRIISKATGQDEQDHWWMLSTIGSSPYYLRFRLKTSVGGTATLYGDDLPDSSDELQTGTWTHAAAVYNSTHMILYKNGIQVGITAKTGSIATDNTISAWIGNNPGANWKLFDGTIDEVKIFEKALTQSEIQAEMAG